MSDEKVRNKFRIMAGEIIGPERTQAVEEAVDDLLHGGPVRAVMEPLR
jgi:hypothetical protein